jgi:hypothetical protein
MKASIDASTQKLLRQVRETREKQDAKRRTPDKHLNGDEPPPPSEPLD